MRSISKAWPARLLAALTVLALVLANVIGAYAHAAGHTPPAAEPAQIAAGSYDHASQVHHMPSKEPAAECEQAGHNHGHEGGGTGQAHLDCCDTICHGGQAILASNPLDLPLPHGAPVIGAVGGFDGAEPGGLDRPPKAIRSA